MRKTMILYDLKNKSNVEKTHIVRKLFGYTDKSNHGDYSYDRDGLISKFKHEKVDKSVIIVNRKDEAQIKKILQKFGLNLILIRLPENKH
jgi:hypothetical protein